MADIYLVNAPNRTRGADRFVEENISILSFTCPGTVIDLYHVGFVVFVEHFIHFVVTCLPCGQYLSYQKNVSFQHHFFGNMGSEASSLEWYTTNKENGLVSFYPNSVWRFVHNYSVFIGRVRWVDTMVKPCCGISSRCLSCSSSLVPGRLQTDFQV